jgi:O-antigen/teichoic acid export membrane protein
MAATHTLIKDSAIYGGSTILVRSVSWLMTTFLTYALSQSDYGMMNYLYAYTALFLVVLTFGMETGFFRFANRKDADVCTVYSTSLILVGSLVLAFLAAALLFLPSLRTLIWDEDAPTRYIRLMLIIVSLDAFSAVPFAYLRYRKRPVKFGLLKLLYIALYAFFCLFFLVLCPHIHRHAPAAIDWFWREDFSLGYVFISNLLATAIQTLCLLPELTGFRYRFRPALAKKMLRYSFPLMLMGLAGMSNQVVDKIIFPEVYPNHDQWASEMGIYNACFKIAMIMMMFTQAFRYAYEPFIFEKNKEKNARRTYAEIMKYFIILGLLVFLGVNFYLDLLKHFIAPTYFGALHIIPVLLIGELFFAIHFNLSIWYKLSDKTHWGALFAGIGFLIITAFNILFIPRYSYHACAWAIFTGNGIILLLSYFIGQKHFPIPYDLKTIGRYAALALTLYALAHFAPIPHTAGRLAFNTLLLGIYIGLMLHRDLPLHRLLPSRRNKPRDRRPF